MSEAHFDSGEADFRREIAATLRANLDAAGACYPPDLLMAARSGVVFDQLEDVLRHVANCAICRQLSQDSEEYEFPAASEAEDGRIRARIPSARTPWLVLHWRPWTMAAAAVLVLAVVVIRNRPLEVKPAKQPAVVSPAQSSVMALAKAQIRIPAASVLTFRGNSKTARAYLADLAAALEPYRQDNYPAADSALGALSRKYPNAAEPPFYRCVSQLFLNQNQRAIDSFLAARSRGIGALQDDNAWYLALALYRVGRLKESAAELHALCSGDGNYRQQACAAADNMKGR